MARYNANTTLHIAEWQRFGLDDIENALAYHHKQSLLQSCKSQVDNAKDIELSQNDKDKIHQKAQKIFAELQEFAKGKGNHIFLNFYGRNHLKARNFVGLIQTKGGFCVEILPKTFAGNKDSNKSQNTCQHKQDAYKFDKQKFDENMKQFINQHLHIADDTDSSDTTESTESNAESPQSCEICQAKAILINCLKTLKNSPFKQSHLSNLKSLHFPLIEIFVKMFLDELDILIKRGIKSDYLTIEANRKFLKGKLLFDKQIKHNLIHKERFFTSSDEYSADISPNRIIKSTIQFLSKQAFSVETTTRVMQMRFIFEDMNESKNLESDFAKCRHSRHFQAYNLILQWCEVFLQRKAFTPYSGADKAFALLFPMEKLFESFIAHHLKWQIMRNKDYKIHIQSTKKKFITCSNGDLFTLKPDIVIEKNKSEIFILDTKWKIPDSSGDEKKCVLQTDLYQMWAYASKYKAKDIWLIYPLCERTKELQNKLNKEKLDKKDCHFTFKADEATELKILFAPLPYLA